MGALSAFVTALIRGARRLNPWNALATVNRNPFPEGPLTMKQFESFRLDTSNECLWQSGAQIALPPKPYAILRYLVENPGRLITHDELLDALWPETYVQPQVLRTYMLELRKVLGDDAGSPRFIQTLPKRGYCFVAPVSDGAEAVNGAAKGTPSVQFAARPGSGCICRPPAGDAATCSRWFN